MKFEDLFKAKQPENYVEYPPKSQPSLDAFFADRSNLPAKKVATPLHPQEVQQIKKEYSTAPGQAIAASTPESTSQSISKTSSSMEKIPLDFLQELYSPDKTSELTAKNLAPSSREMDVDKVKAQVDKLAPQMGIGDYIAHLSPLLVEALVGGGEAGGVSAGIAGENILKDIYGKEKRKQTLEDKLLEMEKARMIASSKYAQKDKPLTTSNITPVVGEDGVVRYQMVPEAVGGVVPEKKIAGLTFEQRKNLKQMDLANRQAQKQRDIQIQAGARYQQKLEADKAFQGYKAQLSESQRALDLLSKGVGVADAGARTTFAKGIFGEVGNLAVQEQVAVSGSPAIAQKYETLKSKWIDGTIGDQDRADMIEVAAAIRDNAPRVLAKIAQKNAQAEKAISGVDVSKIGAALSQDVTTGGIKVEVVHPISKRIFRIPIEDYPEAVRQHKVKLHTKKK